MILLATWEAGYRAVGRFHPETNPRGWKEFRFPAPSHVLDATLFMLNIRTGFGEPVGPDWPWPKSAPSARPLEPWYRGPLIEALGISMLRLAAGFSVSIALGTALGLAMWRSKELDQFFGPLCLGLQTLPSVCWVPLAVLTLGLNESGILFVIVMGSFAAVAIGLRDGLKTIPPLFQRAGLMLGARGWKLYRYVLLPASMPAMTSSLRQGFAFAWRSLLGAELILAVQHHGIGFLLEIGRNISDVAQIVAVLIIMVIVGMAVDRWVFAKLQKRVHARFGLA